MHLKGQYLARCSWRAIMSLLPPNISSSLHLSVPSIHSESRPSHYCGRVSKVLNKPRLNPSLKFYFYSSVAFFFFSFFFPNHQYSELLKARTLKPSQATLLCHPFLPHSFLYSPRYHRDSYSTDLINQERTRLAPQVQFSNIGTQTVLMTFCLV